MNPSIIILEGVDNAGKTTLARKLSACIPGSFNWHLTWTPRLGEAMEDYMLECFNNAIANLEQGRTIIIDRFWPSDAVYGSVFRKGPSFDHVDLINSLRHFRAIYIYCHSDEAIMNHRKDPDPDHNYTDRDMHELLSSYVRWWSLFSKDYTNRTLTHNLEEAKDRGVEYYWEFYRKLTTLD